MIVRKRPKEKRINKKLFNCFTVSLLETLFFITIKIIKLIQKKPQRINSIQKGEIWQLLASKRNGPNLPILVKNSGAQLTPIPLTNGLKYQEKGREKTIKEITKITVFAKNFTENPKRKKNIINVNKIYIGPSKALVM